MFVNDLKLIEFLNAALEALQKANNRAAVWKKSFISNWMSEEILLKRF